MDLSLQQFRCPACGGHLEPSGAEAAGALRCEAGHEFPVVDGIPRFVAEADYTRSFGRQWNHWATTQMDSVNGTSIFHGRFSRYFGPPEQLDGLRVLDAGCGVGAFVDVVSPHASEVVGFDLSSAVEAAARNVGDRPNVAIAQADIFAPPFAAGSFDFVYCIGVIQHTPDPEGAFRALARLVRPAGRLGVWIYERDRWEAVKPRHLLRRFTSRLGPERGMRFVDAYAPRALRTRQALSRLGDGGLRKLVPVADARDYGGDVAHQLDDEQLAEWTLMDTHDMLVTTYDSPQRPETVAGWFRSEGFEEPRRADCEAIGMSAVKR